MRITYDGNVGIGASPVATHTNFKNLTLGGLTTLTSNSGTSAGGFLALNHNSHIDTDDSWEYIVTDEASMYQQLNGEHRFYTVGSGTAGNNITWSERLRIQNDGDIGINTASPSQQLSGANRVVQIKGELVLEDGAGNSTYLALGGAQNARNYVYSTGNIPLDIATNNVVRMTITGGGVSKYGDDTGTLVVAGNLQVDGTTTTINSTTVAIDDLNFSIATDAADSAAANGAGITIGGAGATLLYTHATTSWDFNKPVNVTGGATFTGTITSTSTSTNNSRHCKSSSKTTSLRAI